MKPSRPNLGSIALGVAGRITAVDVAPDDRSRLTHLGIRTGAVVHVVNRSALGACVIALGSDRVAVDAATAALIAVEVLDPATSLEVRP